MKREIAIVAAIVIVMLLPFVNRCLFVDDHALYKEAVAARSHRANPYLTDASDPESIGWTKGAAPAQLNPFLYFTIVGSLDKLAGSRLWAIHLSFILFAVISGICFYLIAFRFVSSPLWATALFLFSPAFWATSTTLLIDPILIALVLLGFWLFLSGYEKNDVRILCAAALALGLAPLAKYSGYGIWTAVFLWVLVQKDLKFFYRRWFFFLVMVIPSLAWYIHNQLTFHSSHFQQALSAVCSMPTAWSLFTAAVFINLVSVFVFFNPLNLDIRKFFLTLGFGVIAFFVLRTSIFGFSGVEAFLIAAACANTVQIVRIFVSALSGFSDRNRFFLAVWLGVSFVILMVQAAWVSGRYILMMMIPLALLITLEVERLLKDRPNSMKFIMIMSIIATVFVGGMMTYTDYAQARVIKDAASIIKTDKYLMSCLDKYYSVHSLGAFSYYWGGLGWKPYASGHKFRKGDVVVIQERMLSPGFQPFPADRSKVISTVTIPATVPFRVLDIPCGTCFYGAVWGFLPYSIVSHDYLEKFTFIEITADSPA